MWNPSTRDGNSIPMEPASEQSKAIFPDCTNGRAGKTPSQAVIGRSILVKGEITGAESLQINGRVEGSIDLANNSVHIGPDAVVMSNLTARELIVYGTVQGNAILDRLDIRHGGSLAGDVTARRISIADGAYFKGSIDMRRTESNVSSGHAMHSTLEKKDDVVAVRNTFEIATKTGS